MRRSNSVMIIIACLFPCSHSLADIPRPEPLSGLNLEDFQSSLHVEPEWDSNPFVKSGDALQTKQMMLLGIIYGKEKSMALINSEIVQVGDKIGSSEVVAIEKQKVVLRNDDGLTQISLKGAADEIPKT